MNGPRPPDAPRASTEPPVVHCRREMEPAEECAVHGEGDALFVRGVVLAPDAVLEGGAVRIDATGRIECVGCECSEVSARVVDCPNFVVSPGFLDLHEHITYASTAPVPDAGERYEHRHQWRLGSDGHAKIAYRGNASVNQVLAQELRLLIGGATSLLGAGGELGLVRNLELEAKSGLGPTSITLQTFPLADSSGARSSLPCDFGARRDGAATVALARAYVPHLGEGIDELAQSEIACSAAGRYALLSPTTAVVHAVAVSAREAELLADSGASVIWSPRSNISLYGNTAPISVLRRMGVPIALGTDWLPSGSMNLLRELSCARRLSESHFDGELSAYDLWAMVTFEAALAIRMQDSLGALSRGRMGDLALFSRRPDQDAFEAVTSAEPAAVRLVVRAGRVLYGDSALVTALAEQAELCGELDVCGAPKRACVETDTGHSLADVRAAGEAVYPLFSCEPNASEPTCEAARPGEYPTSDIHDPDADGIPSSGDVCPLVFDPPRPLDGATQADTDQDGRGDACDACPLDASDSCTPRTGFDRDRDGLPDATDSCPFTSDAEAVDSDGDGHGDACDFCADPNPGSTPCQLPIRALRDAGAKERPPLGSPVAIEGRVTALRPDGHGFFVQDAEEPYSAIQVYAASTELAVALREPVRVRGVTHRFDGFDELLFEGTEAASVGPIEPILVPDAASVGDSGALRSALDGLLVHLDDVTVSNGNPDAPSDFDETLLTGDLRLDDWLYPELDNALAEGTRMSVTGILGRSFGHMKLWPRGADDIVVR